MPPPENKNNTSPNVSPFQTGIDPIFKGNQGQQTSPPKTPVSAFNVLNNQKYTPTETPVTHTAPIVENPTGPKSIVRTYKSDLESAIQTNHLSSINIAIAENQKMHRVILPEQSGVDSEDNGSAGNPKYRKILILSAILVIFGIIAIITVYLLSVSTTQQAIITREFPALITTEVTNESNLETISKNILIDTLAGKINSTKVPQNNFYATFITTGSTTAKKLISSTEFITLTKLDVPSLLKRTLLPNYMIGSYSYGVNFPFIIFRTSSFENTYTGMLDWEKSLEKDLTILFRLPGYDAPRGIAEQLTAVNFKKFEDAVVSNKDVRLIRNEAGKIILIYGIVDKTTVIITTSDTAFKEIVNRLNKEKAIPR
jgi:hypothetical protein